MKIELNKPFAGNSPADEEDVRAVKRSLNWLGHYTPFKKTGLTTMPDHDVFEALKSFQTEHDLPATGAAKPGDDTLKALNKQISQKLKGQ